MGFLLKIEGLFGNFYVDFFCKIEGEFNFLVNFFFWSNSILKEFLL